MPLSHLRRHKGLSFLLLLILLYFGWETWSRRGEKEAAGIYLAHGGRTLVVLERGWFNRLAWIEGFIPTMSHTSGFSLNQQRSVNFSEGNIHLSQLEFGDFEGNPVFHMTLQTDLAPSKAVPGDWDLVGAEYYDRTQDPNMATSPGFVTGSGQGGSLPTRVGVFLSDLYKWAVTAIKRKFEEPETNIRMKLDPTKAPVQSFLHRINDPRLVSYFRARRSGDVSPAALEESRSLFAEHKDDPYMAVHAIDTEAQFGQVAKADALIKEWRKRLEETEDPFLRQAAEIAFKSVATAKGLPEGRDMRALLFQLNGTERTLEERLELLKGLWKEDLLPETTFPLTPTHEDLVAISFCPNYLEIQFLGNIVNTLAYLNLIQGDRSEAISQLASAYRLGQAMNSDGALIQRLIGMRIRMNAIDGLETFVLNACETEENREDIWVTLEKLDKSQKRQTIENLRAGEFPHINSIMELDGGTVHFSSSHPSTRNSRADARFQVLRAAMVAKHHHHITGSYPRSASDFVALLPDGLPNDPFSYFEESLRIAGGESETFRVYSVGPDDTDDLGLVRYDPTNGTLSAGDVVVSMPCERQYPFLQAGLIAQDATGVSEAFPAGFPDDFFQLRGRGGLSIYDSGPDSPVKIFGFGPAMPDQYEFSNSVLYNRPELEPLSGPLEGRFQFFFQKEPVPGRPSNLPYFTLGPYYDPTNGAQSDGHLFIEIPRQ